MTENERSSIRFEDICLSSVRFIAPFTRVPTEGKSGFAKDVIDSYFEMTARRNLPVHPDARHSEILQLQGLSRHS